MRNAAANQLVRLCVALLLLSFVHCTSTETDFTDYEIGDGDQWSFLNGAWQDGPEGALFPPDGGGKEYLAVINKRAYSDFEARFRFKFRHPHGGARFLFRLQDAQHYYALDIPWCGQQNRNRHFWAGIVKVDGKPLQPYLDLQLITGVAPRHDYWYQGRVKCTGPRIQAWIEGRLAADLEDSTFASGRVGLMSLITAGKNSPHFADLEVSGTFQKDTVWRDLEAPAKHWITPNPEVDPETYQTYPSHIVRSKSGELAFVIPYGNPSRGETGKKVWVRSTDKGRTWSKPEPASFPARNPATAFAGNSLGPVVVQEDGTWVSFYFKEEGPIEEAMYAFESKDEGRTWDRRRTVEVQGDWPEEFRLPVSNYDRPLQLRDGTFLLAVSGKVADPPDFHEVSTNFVFRTTDEGETWSAPVRCDRNNRLPGDKEDRWWCPADFSELALAEVGDNAIIGFGRPRPWPYMWQVQSNDGGHSWAPAAFGPFPGYCITLTRTVSGALVALKRFPYFSANVSWDGGVTWDAGTIVDYPLWANHHAIEAEPDVVLVTYLGHIVEPGQPDVRMLRLRVTRDGLILDN
jgi:hypothetical protein